MRELVDLAQNVPSCCTNPHTLLTDLLIASADRRPVDPPPVVELKVFEGELDAKTDITFSHNANFFLFTTLENARPIAKGRLPLTPPTFPVLTGSPVAGMAYLDRPSPAGYFIFPDLSVRHEGMYRLSFSLFEELKETKDFDVEPPEGSPKARDKLLSSHPMAPRAHVHFRLEVKSTPFAVFSAKKFPGLSESTPLSRTVAEQGCRVRIRRDVRMRRRDKPNEAYQGEYDEEVYAQPDRFGTPQHIPDRPRSVSNGSMDAHTPYSTGRRPSIQQDYFQQQGSYAPASYQQPAPPAPAPVPVSVPVQSATSYGNHLSFGGTSASTITFPPPQLPTQTYMQNASGLQNTNGIQYPPNIHSRQMSAPQNFGYHQTQNQTLPYTNHTNYNLPQAYTENPDYRPIMDHRRSSASVLTHQTNVPSTMNNYVQNHTGFQQSYFTPQQQQTGSRTPTPLDTNGYVPPQLPPLRTESFSKHVAMEPKYELKSPSINIPRPIVPSPSYTNGYDSYASTVPQSAHTMPNPLSARTAKREFGTVFDTSHLNQPIHNGMRPTSADQGREREFIEADQGANEDAYEDLDDFRAKTLIYKRADGSQQAKKCPSPIDGSG